jgi:hypothetical protein
MFFYLTGQRYLCTYFYTSTYPKVCIMTAIKESSTIQENKQYALVSKHFEDEGRIQ